MLKLEIYLNTLINEQDFGRVSLLYFSTKVEVSEELARRPEAQFACYFPDEALIVFVKLITNISIGLVSNDLKKHLFCDGINVISHRPLFHYINCFKVRYFTVQVDHDERQHT